MPAAANKVSRQGLLIETAAGVFDLSSQYAAATPAPTGVIVTTPVAGRDSPLRTPTRVDLRYALAGFLDATSGEAAAIRKAARLRETIGLLEMQHDNLHWWLSRLLLPSVEDQDGPLFQFTLEALADGSPWAHGVLIDGGLKTAQDVSHVPAGALGMVAIVEKGSLTALTLRYTASSQDYDLLIAAPDPGITIAQLETSANATIPASAPTGTLTIIPTPSDISDYKIQAGFGLHAFEVN